MAVKCDADVGALKPVLAAALDDSPGLLVQTGPTLLYSVHLANGAAALTYIQCFNAAALSDVTLGTTVADIALPIIASGVLDIDLKKPVMFPKGLVVFSTNSATGSTGATANGSFFVG
jgi:hypothetical protein